MNIRNLFICRTREKEAPKKVILRSVRERPDCYDGDADWGERTYPGDECAGCKYWNIINPSGEDTGWCYKHELSD